MVKGVSRQVIVVRPQDGKLYEQAIFILHEDAVDVTDEMLLREAVQLTGRPKRKLAGWIWPVPVRLAQRQPGGSLCCCKPSTDVRKRENP